MRVRLFCTYIRRFRFRAVFLVRLFADVCKNAAVDVQDMSVDEVGGIACQEYRRTGHIIRRAPALRRSLGNDEAVKRMAAAVRLTLTERCGLRGCDITRAKTVALDVVFSVFRAS